MNNYFTSDYHLDHANVIRYDKRPFKDTNEMNEYIIKMQNETVKPEDNFFFLGDFSFNSKRTEYFLTRLTGKLHFIKGNHDHKDTVKLYEKYGNYLGEQRLINVNGQEIVLNHYSMDVWNKSHHGSWHLYGHSHGSLPDNKYARKFDVGCMLHKYIPLELEDVRKIINKKEYQPIDHHGKRDFERANN